MKKLKELFDRISEKQAKIINIVGLIFIVLLFGLMSCNNSNDFGDIIIEDVITENYLCEHFVLESDEYSSDKLITFKTKIFTVGDVVINEKALVRYINAEYKDVGFTFKTAGVSPITELPNNISCYDFLDGYYRNGFITIIIIPDSYRFNDEQGRVFQGKALGIPSIKNPSKGKPVLFIRQSVAYSNILIHELGHIFGLPHTFAGEDMLDYGFNCFSGDKIPDTITLPDGLGVGRKTCEAYIPKDLDTLVYTPKRLKDAISNYMSYSSPHCMDHFSEGQIQEQRKMVEVNSRIQDAIL